MRGERRTTSAGTDRAAVPKLDSRCAARTPGSIRIAQSLGSRNTPARATPGPVRILGEWGGPTRVGATVTNDGLTASGGRPGGSRLEDERERAAELCHFIETSEPRLVALSDYLNEPSPAGRAQHSCPGELPALMGALASRNDPSAWR